MGLYGPQTFTRPNRNSIRTRRDSGEERKGKENMLQYPSFMLQYPYSTRIIPTSFLLPAQWPQPQSDELLLAMEESDFEEKVRHSPLSLSLRTVSKSHYNVVCICILGYQQFPIRFYYKCEKYLFHPLRISRGSNMRYFLCCFDW